MVALTAHTVVDALPAQCLGSPSYAVLAEAGRRRSCAAPAHSGCRSEVLYGTQALERVAAHPDWTRSWPQSSAPPVCRRRLLPSARGKRVLLANKEALVMAGELFMRAVRERGATLLPIDSEHNAMFQCLPHDARSGAPETACGASC